MPRVPLPRHARLFARTSTISCMLALCALVATSGCKTSEDASVAATQLSKTSEALTAYYAALHKELDATDQLNALDEAIDGVPYDEQTRGKILDTAAEVAKREALAGALGQVAASFSKLKSSTAPADIAASAGKLETQIEGLKLFNGTLDSPEKNALAAAVQGIATLVQEHKERQAAQKMSKTVDALAKFFDSERNAYDSINDQYSDFTRILTLALLKRGQVDTSGVPAAMLKVALDPYALPPNLSDDALRAKIQAEASKQVTQKSTQMKSDYRKATQAMEDSLNEMAKRIDTLANDKMGSASSVPATLSTVNHWAATILGN